MESEDRENVGLLMLYISPLGTISFIITQGSQWTAVSWNET